MSLLARVLVSPQVLSRTASAIQNGCTVADARETEIRVTIHYRYALPLYCHTNSRAAESLILVRYVYYTT